MSFLDDIYPFCIDSSYLRDARNIAFAPCCEWTPFESIRQQLKEEIELQDLTWVVYGIRPPIRQKRIFDLIDQLPGEIII